MNQAYTCTLNKKKKYNSVEFQSNQVKVNASNQTYTINLRLKK